MMLELTPDDAGPTPAAPMAFSLRYSLEQILPSLVQFRRGLDAVFRQDRDRLFTMLGWTLRGAWPRPSVLCAAKGPLFK